MLGPARLDDLATGKYHGRGKDVVNRQTMLSGREANARAGCVASNSDLTALHAKDVEPCGSTPEISPLTTPTVVARPDDGFRFVSQ